RSLRIATDMNHNTPTAGTSATSPSAASSDAGLWSPPLDVVNGIFKRAKESLRQADGFDQLIERGTSGVDALPGRLDERLGHDVLAVDDRDVFVPVSSSLIRVVTQPAQCGSAADHASDGPGRMK